MNDKIIIPYTELENTIDDCFNHLVHIQKTSKHNYYNYNYDVSIFFSVILLEEITKYSIYSKHYREKKDLRNNEFKNLLQHKFKLQELLINEYDENFVKINDSSLSENIKIELRKKFETTKENNLRFVKSFNLLKQFALYHNWRENRSLTLNKQISKNHINHLSNYLLEFSSFVFNRECLIHKYNIESLTDNKVIIHKD